MHSAVLILPIELKRAGDQIGELMGWGPVSYTIPLMLEGANEPTHVGLRADVNGEFIDMVYSAKLGHYVSVLPADLINQVMNDLIVDFSPNPLGDQDHVLWGAEHFDAVCKMYKLIRA